MSLVLKTIYSALTGALGALVAWLILDVLLELQPSNAYVDALLNGALVGLAVGVAVNGFYGLMEFKLVPFLRGAGIGLLAGLIGGTAGLLAGEALFQNLGSNDLLRILGWGLFGLFLGLADGLLARSTRRMLYASIGGLLGGVIGGTAFTLLAGLSDLPYTSRALGFALVGLMTGLFIGLLPTVLRDAWIKVISSGRNEGKERLLDKPRVVIGASSSCDLALYGDPGIAAKHAEIAQEGKQYILRPIGGNAVLVNNPHPTTPGAAGEPSLINRHVLENEQTFQIGSETLIFRRRSG